MKVCVVGGPMIHAYLFCEALFKEGMEVIYLHDQGYKFPEYHPSYKVFGIFDENAGYFARLAQLSNYLKEYKPEVLHFMWTFNPRKDWLSSYLLTYLKPEVVYTVNNIIPHEPAFGERQAMKKIYQKVDKLHVFNQWSKNELVENFKIKPEKIRVIPLGNYSYYRRFCQVTKEEARKVLNLKLEEKVILFFGAIRDYKGVEYLLKSYPIVLKKIPNSKLVVAGSLKRQDIAKYCDLIKQLGIEENTMFTPLFIPEEICMVYFLAADLVVLPYLECTCSAIIQIAFAFGRPVISTNVGGLPELVEEGKNGLLIPPKDEANLAEAIIDLLTDEKRLEEMGRYAQYVSEQKYNWKNIAQEMIKFYSS